MKDPKQNAANREVSLDDLVALVEKAAVTISRLQDEVARQKRQIRALEQAQEAVREDVDWSRWFRQKYQNTVYYPVIEKAYLEDRPSASAADPDLAGN